MAENDVTTNTEPTTEPEQPGTDWEAKYKEMRQHSRDWERKAKANEAAAAELEQLKAASLSEQEKAERRAEKAEAELDELRAQMQRTADAQEIAASSGVPLALLMHCSDRADMESFVREYEAEHHVPAAPGAPESRVIRGDGAKVSNRDIFADYVSQIL